jgi:hypothetical protein
MADLTRVHGSPSGNVSYDRSVANVGNITVDELVDVVGRKLDFFKIVIQNGSDTNQDLRSEMGPNECVEKVLQIIQNYTDGTNEGTATLVAYQVEGDNTGQISVAVEGSSWTASALQASIRATTTLNSINVTGTDVTEPGLDLA